ncbi:MAG: hypothetical protein ACTHNU_07120, partial [Gaiellales bacterium]
MAYDVALYLHLLSAFVLVGAVATVGVCYFRLRVATTPVDALPWARVADGAGWVFPVAILGLLGSGAYLTTDRWTWSTAWILASIAGLILDTLQGPLIGGPRAKALKEALDEAGRTGVLDANARQLTRDRVLWIVLLANPGIVLGITWNMTVKPGTAGAVAAIVIGYAVGAAAALMLTKQPRRRAAV